VCLLARVPLYDGNCLELVMDLLLFIPQTAMLDHATVLLKRADSKTLNVIGQEIQHGSSMDE